MNNYLRINISFSLNKLTRVVEYASKYTIPDGTNIYINDNNNSEFRKHGSN